MRWERAIICSLLKELKSSEFDQAHKSILYNAATDLAENKNTNEWSEQLLKLIDESHQKMQTADSVIQLNYWRTLYTDSSILRGIAQFNLACPFEAITTLDYALIVAGAYGRLSLIWAIIHRIQSNISCDSAASHQVPAVPKEVTFTPICTQETILEISPPSFLSFQFDLSQKPFILRQYANNWPALRDRPWSSAAYLRSIAGPGRVVPVEIGHDYRAHSWTQELMGWDHFLSTLDFEDQPASEAPRDIFYLAQHDLTRQFPSLLEDIIVPDYAYSSLTSHDFPAYHQPLNDKKMLYNTWLGPKGTVSPAHTDPYFNFYVQVVGYKSVWLAPPSASSSMYPMPSLSDLGPNSNMLNNTSQVDVFADRNQLERFPEFMRRVLPVSMCAVLSPGDVLFFPPGWWHAMKSEISALLGFLIFVLLAIRTKSSRLASLIREPAFLSEDEETLDASKRPRASSVVTG